MSCREISVPLSAIEFREKYVLKVGIFDWLSRKKIKIGEAKN
jgi:hypothetical protein